MSGTATLTRPEPFVLRNRGVLGVAGAVLAVVTVLSLLAVRSSGHRGDLDPENPDPGGAQAVARVLAAQGVELSVVRRAAELDRSGVDAGTTLMVTSSEHLGVSTATRLQESAERAGTVVLAAPVGTLRRAVGLPVTVADEAVAGRRGARCGDDLLRGLTIQVEDSSGYVSDDPRVTLCFEGLVARTDRTYAVGGAGLFANGQVEEADDAAVVLRLLGGHDRLIWYVPDTRDVPAGDAGSVSGQLPRGLFPGIWLLAAALVTTMVWRGRRLGPLVVEPLPVVVKAVESTQGRGRLYRRVRDRSHAAGILRAATRRRLASRLGLPSGAGLDELARSVATASGRDPVAVLDLLGTRPVTDDGTLTQLSEDLSALEREVRA